MGQMTMGPRLPLAQKVGPNLDSRQLRISGPGFPICFHKQVLILLLFGFELEVPAIDFGPIRHLGRIHPDPHPVPLVLIVEVDGKPAQVDHLEPAVADGARGEELHRVREDRPGFADGIEEHAVRELAQGQIHHKTADDQSRGDIAMERLDQLQILIIGIGTDIHFNEYNLALRKIPHPQCGWGLRGFSRF